MIENKKNLNKLFYSTSFVFIGGILTAIMIVIAFIFRVYFIVGFPLSAYGGGVWFLSFLVILALIAAFFGGLVGLIISLLKVSIPKGILIGLFASLFYNTIEMLLFADSSNIPVRNAFLATALIAGTISHIVVGGLLAVIKNNFKTVDDV